MYFPPGQFRLLNCVVAKHARCPNSVRNACNANQKHAKSCFKSLRITQDELVWIKKYIGSLEQLFYFALVLFVSKKNRFKARYERLNEGMFRTSLQPSLFTSIGNNVTYAANEYRTKLLQSTFKSINTTLKDYTNVS